MATPPRRVARGLYGGRRRDRLRFRRARKSTGAPKVVDTLGLAPQHRGGFGNTQQLGLARFDTARTALVELLDESFGDTIDELFNKNAERSGERHANDAQSVRVAVGASEPDSGVNRSL
jgi:hypothetical protein